MTHVEFQKVKDEYVDKLYAYMPSTTNLDTNSHVAKELATIHTCRNLLMLTGYINQPSELALALHGVLQTAKTYFDWLQTWIDERIASATMEFITVIQNEFPKMETTTAQPMTVRNLIDILTGIENKSLPVYVYLPNICRLPARLVDERGDCVDIGV